MSKLLYPKITHFLFLLASELALCSEGMPEVTEYYKINSNNNKNSLTPNPSKCLDTTDSVNYLAVTLLS